MTTFDCALCDQNMVFKPSDPNTYLNKEETGNAFVGKLYTYRVAHQTEFENHVNVVVFDQTNNYRAHKDAFPETISTSSIDINYEFQKLFNRIPNEVRYLFLLTDRASKQYLLKLNQFENITLKLLYEELSAVITNSTHPSLLLINTKLSLVLNLPIDYPDDYEYNWHRPLQIRKKSRSNVSNELLEDLENFVSPNEIVSLELAVAKAEVALRLSKLDVIEAIYEKVSGWKSDDEIFKKQAFYTIQAYLGYAKFLDGQFNLGRDLVEPSFKFAQIIDNNELIITAGNFLGSIIKNSGNLTRAPQIYEIVLETAKKIGDERSELMISNNLATVHYQNGQLEKALNIFTSVREHALSDDQYIFSLVAIINIAEVLLKLGRIEEAIEVIKEGMIMDLPLQYRIPIYDTFLQITRAKGDIVLIDYFEQHFKSTGFDTSINGQVIILDIEATKAELNSEFDMAIEYLEQQQVILRDNNQVEKLSRVELRIAENYFMAFKESGEKDYLNYCFDHINEISILAREQGYTTLHYQLTFLKAMIAAEIGSYDRVNKLLKEAKKIATEYNLDVYLTEVVQAIKDLKQGKLLEQDEHDTRELFLKLENSRVQVQPDSTQIYGIEIFSNDFSWNMSYFNDSSDHVKGFREGYLQLWRYSKDHFEKRGNSIINADEITVMIYFGQEYHSITFLERVDNQIKRKQSELIEKLEQFELQQIISEREAYLSQILEEKFNITIQ